MHALTDADALTAIETADAAPTRPMLDVYADFAENVMAMLADLSPTKPVPSG